MNSQHNFASGFRLVRFMVFNATLTKFRLYRDGRDRMVVGFTTTCAISAYHH
jgi:hypothetical protein